MIPCRWKAFLRNAGIKQEFVEEYAQLFDKNRYVFLCMLNINTIVSKNIICPAQLRNAASEIHPGGGAFSSISCKIFLHMVGYFSLWARY